jgi:hypothetical protein
MGEHGENFGSTKDLTFLSSSKNGLSSLKNLTSNQKQRHSIFITIDTNTVVRDILIFYAVFHLNL